MRLQVTFNRFKMVVDEYKEHVDDIEERGVGRFVGIDEFRLKSHVNQNTFILDEFMEYRLVVLDEIHLQVRIELLLEFQGAVSVI